MIRARGTALSVLLILSAPLLMASNCEGDNPLTKINYEQRGACNGFRHSAGTTSAGPNQAYAVFRISTIDNKSSGTKDFNFDPNKLFINADPDSYASTSTQLWGANPFTVQGRLVKAGSTETFNGAFIIITQTVDADGAKEASKVNYFPLYDAPDGSQRALMVKENHSQTEWPYTPDCTTITY